MSAFDIVRYIWTNYITKYAAATNNVDFAGKVFRDSTTISIRAFFICRCEAATLRQIFL